MRTVLLAIILLISPMLPAVDVEFDTWEVPWPRSRPRDPFVAPDGKVWFVGQGDDYAAYLDPRNDNFVRFDLEKGTGPHNLIVADNHTVFYAGNRNAHIGMLDRVSGNIRKLDMPSEISDPHTLAFDSAGNVFFTAQQSNYVAHLDRDSGQVKSWSVPTPRARPYGIKVDADDQPWVALLGTNKLATIVENELVEIDLPRPGARPRRLEITTDGRVWYVDYAEGYLGAFDPATGGFKEWRAPSAADSRPYGTAADAVDRIWFVETGPQPNRLVAFDTASEEFVFNGEIPDSGGAVRHMYFDANENAIWFGMDTNYLGRAHLDR